MNPNLLAGLQNRWESLTGRLNAVGEYLPPLVLRIIMGWEFFESGREKLGGENWFASVQDQFPFPFSVIPAGLSWGMATWFELIGAVLLIAGLGTRAVAFSLLFLTFVATSVAHWPDMWSMWSDLLAGYSITDRGHGNFKLPLLFVVMLLPLIFSGGGKLSLDYLFGIPLGADPKPPGLADFGAFGLAALVLGLPFLMLVPMFGATLIVIGVALLAFQRWVVG